MSDLHTYCVMCGYEDRPEKPCACDLVGRLDDANERIAEIIRRIPNAAKIPWRVTPHDGGA